MKRLLILSAVCALAAFACAATASALIPEVWPREAIPIALALAFSFAALPTVWKLRNEIVGGLASFGIATPARPEFPAPQTGQPLATAFG